MPPSEAVLVIDDEHAPAHPPQIDRGRQAGRSASDDEAIDLANRRLGAQRSVERAGVFHGAIMRRRSRFWGDGDSTFGSLEKPERMPPNRTIGEHNLATLGRHLNWPLIPNH